MTLTYPVEREVTDLRGNDVFKEFILEVEYSVTRASRGRRDSMGVPEEPDEEAELEVGSIVDKDTGNEFEVTADELDRITEECWEDLASRADDPD